MVCAHDGQGLQIPTLGLDHFWYVLSDVQDDHLALVVRGVHLLVSGTTAHLR
jgi:hypothetical protein